MRVLLVEDDTSTAKSIELMLKSEGFVVDATDLGEDGLEIGKLYDYDIIILDLMLPDIDGYEVLRRLRAARVATPVLILSGLSEPDQKIKGLGFGADDYLTKPFDKRELVARLHAVVRRSKGHAESIIRTGKLAISLDTGMVEVDGQPLHVTVKEHGILQLLSLRKGVTLSKEKFLDHLYGAWTTPSSRPSTCSYASCARSWRRPPKAQTISRRCGAAVTSCAIPRSSQEWWPTDELRSMAGVRQTLVFGTGRGLYGNHIFSVL